MLEALKIFLICSGIVIGATILAAILSFVIAKFGTAGHLRAKERSNQKKTKQNV